MGSKMKYRLDFIARVIDSCFLPSQAETAVVWIGKMCARYSRMKERNHFADWYFWELRELLVKAKNKHFELATEEELNEQRRTN